MKVGLEELASAARKVYEVVAASKKTAGSRGGAVSSSDVFSANTDLGKSIEALNKAIEHIEALNE